MADRDQVGCYRRLADALDDVQTLLGVIALLPYAVSVRPAQVPAQRRPLPSERRPAPRGVPARPVELWPVPRPNRIVDYRRRS